MPSTPIQSPASYIPSRAAAFADVDGTSILVSASSPMPVSLAAATNPSPAALSGLAASSVVLGPYQPSLERSVILALSGSWSGTAKLLRSTDGGTTKLPLTIGGSSWAQFSANCCEPVREETESAARLWLDITLASGTLSYRLGQ